mmetsp:Transcript_39617/g.97940  ORF Transcript_39617/g.97940 Transcript_39617/m.97940 type:complete len:156 (-) Transcript_39617:25-492(-)
MEAQQHLYMQQMQQAQQAQHAQQQFASDSHLAMQPNVQTNVHTAAAQGHGQARVLGQVQLLPGQVVQAHACVLPPGLAPGVAEQHLQPAPALYATIVPIDNRRTATVIYAATPVRTPSPVPVPSPVCTPTMDGGNDGDTGTGGGSSPESEIEDLD